VTTWVGRTLSKVRIERLIARGGMAEVYLGQHETLNRPMVVKILYDHLSADSHLLARFHTEAQAVASLRHPNIVRVFDFDLIDDRPYIVMELIKGFSLEAYLRELKSRSQSLVPEDIAYVTQKIASALDYAHSEGVLHRDIKPANVMLRKEAGPIKVTEPLNGSAEPILTDFGLARIGANSVQTKPGMIMGTPAYMSPEQVQGGHVDARADIYALGIMTYEMLTLHRPFGSEDDPPASVMYKQVHEPPPIIPDSHSRLQKVMNRALAKDPEKRYPTTGEFAADLERELDHAQAGNRGRPRSLRPFLLAGLGLALLTIFATAGLIWDHASGLPQLEETPPEYVYPAAQVSPALEEQQTSVPAAIAATTTPAAPVPNTGIHSMLELAAPDYVDHFDDPELWYTYDFEDTATYRIEDGELTGVDHTPEELYTWWTWVNKQSGNVYTEVTARNGDCVGRDSLGIAVRVDDNSKEGGYGFEVSCDGHWRLRRHRIGKDPKDLTEWAPSEHILQGQGAINRLGLLAYQDRFLLFANDEVLGEVIDPEYARSFGSFALFVRSSLTYELMAHFDDFSFWHIRYLPE
jgi:serine/threonine protein kinase